MFGILQHLKEALHRVGKILTMAYGDRSRQRVDEGLHNSLDVMVPRSHQDSPHVLYLPTIKQGTTTSRGSSPCLILRKMAAKEVEELMEMRISLLSFTVCTLMG